MIAIFDISITGPPPGTATVSTSQWIDLGVIPIGFKIWFGKGYYTSPDKSITFEIRTNTIGNSTGSDGTTSLLASTAVSPRSGNLFADYYRKGRLHIVSVTGTGTEHFWLKLKSKTSAAGSYLFTIYYTLE